MYKSKRNAYLTEDAKILLGEIEAIIKPPEVFTPDEVNSLNQYQCSGFHPFTCPNRGSQHFSNGIDLGVLIPTTRGWICQYCDYTQDWAHDFMKNYPKVEEIYTIREIIRDGEGA